MKFLTALAILTLSTLPSLAQAAAPDVYGIHLYFDEREFVDVLTLERRDDGTVTGQMHVPNDFDGELQNVALSGETLSFEILVPRNQSRPRDLIFHYTGRFFDTKHEQLVGFVTLKDSPGFIASFTGFLRK